MNRYDITGAGLSDTEELLALYRTEVGGAAQWSEHYPAVENIEDDISRDSLFIIRDDEGSIIAAVSIDCDPGVDALECWDPALFPGGEFSRIVVRKDMRGRGLAHRLIEYVASVLKSRGMKSIHILVIPTHTAALSLYGKEGFVKVGECDMYEKHFVCLEKPL